MPTEPNDQTPEPNQNPNVPQEESSKPEENVLDVLEELESEEPQPEPEAAEPTQDEPEEDDIDDERLNRILKKRGIMALSESDIAEALKKAAPAEAAPENVSRETFEDEDEDIDWDYLQQYEPKEYQRQIQLMAVKEVSKVNSLANTIVDEILAEVPEITQEEAEVIRKNILGSGRTAKEIQSFRKSGDHIKIAESYAYKKSKMSKSTPEKKPAGNPTKTNKAVERPAPKVEAPAGKNEQRDRLSAALRDLGHNVNLGGGK